VATLYRFAALAVHPDRPGGDAASMARVNQAAELLRKGPRPTLSLLSCALRPYEADQVMRWGKHRGLPLGQIPLGYLGWLADEVDDQGIRPAARLVLHWRTCP
jgi:hypothetical protein